MVTRGTLKPLIVEFAGLPGAGKTTTAQRAVELLHAKGYRCAWRPSLIAGTWSRLSHRARFLLFRLAHWRLVMGGLLYALSIRPLRFSRVRYLKHLLFLVYYQKEQGSSDYDVILMDQSVVQTMWATSVHSGSPLDSSRLRGVLSRLYRAAAGSMVFVVFHIDPATAAQRVVERASMSKRFDCLPFADVKGTFAANQDTLRAITEHAIAATGAPGLAIDGARPCAVNAGRIADFLAALVESGARGTRCMAVGEPAAAQSVARVGACQGEFTVHAPHGPELRLVR